MSCRYDLRIPYLKTMDRVTYDKIIKGKYLNKVGMKFVNELYNR